MRRRQFITGLSSAAAGPVPPLSPVCASWVTLLARQSISIIAKWRMHQPIPAQGRWLERVVRGYFNYHAVPTNGRALEVFRHHITNLWRRTLRRRSQKDRMTWARMMQLVDAWLPKPIILHPLAERSLCRHTPKVGEAMGRGGAWLKFWHSHAG